MASKPRRVCLISTILNREQFSSVVVDASNVPVNPQLDSGCVQRSFGKLLRNRNKKPATYSQVWKDDKPSQESCGECSDVICASVQGVPENCSETLTSNWTRPGWTTRICEFQIICSLDLGMSRTVKSAVYLG